MSAEDTAFRDDRLMPDRHPQADIFICDVADAVLKDIQQELEHPFYSLSKKPEIKIRRYEHNGNTLEVTPSVKGLATIYDKDILIYCISQIMAKLNRQEKVSQVVKIVSHDLLQFTNRGTSGRDYQALKEALDRLAGTRISTNIRSGDEVEYRTFGLIDSAGMRRKEGHDGRLLWCEIKLSDWVFNAIRHNEVLTLHRDYFRLRKPIERRVYELARKHCGTQPEWTVSLAKLHLKSGAKTHERDFRYMLKELANSDHLPDYSVQYDAERDMLTFRNRNTMPAITAKRSGFAQAVRLDADIHDAARQAAPGWDTRYLEEQWRGWMAEGLDEAPRDPNAAFIGFCRKWYAKRGTP